MVDKADVISAMEAIAPPFCMESWDNCGVLIDGKDDVSDVTVMLDPTIDAIQSVKSDFIVSHHPLIFSPLLRIELDIKDKVELLLKRDQTFYAAHTSLDFAPRGVSWALAQRIDLDEDEMSTPQMRTGKVGYDTIEEFVSFLELQLHTTDIRIVGNASKLDRVAALPGSGFHEDVIEACARQGITTILSGDLKHHAALKGMDLGITLIDAGHLETEMPGVEQCARELGHLVPDIDIDVMTPAKPWHTLHYDDVS
ncbi:MAG TPA: Nif3-like dinuclear metal center hexameric protein [Methanomicrobia archaeon]|nr:Nif3-like dinuclear metal center hexameric protein [Methanomicrobia archaeon]